MRERVAAAARVQDEAILGKKRLENRPEAENYTQSLRCLNAT